jgi:hypothetical protein
LYDEVVVKDSRASSDTRRLPQFAVLLEALKVRPEMYLRELRYSVLVAYVEGYDAATGGRCLDGFQEWVEGQLEISPGPIHWSFLIAAQRREPVAGEGFCGMTELEDRECIADLLATLSAFQAQRELR